MIQVWFYDENMILTESDFVEELGENMTGISPNGLGLYQKKFDGEKWIEGWSQEQIQAWHDEQNKEETSHQNVILEENTERITILEQELITTNQYITELELMLLEQQMGGNVNGE